MKKPKKIPEEPETKSKDKIITIFANGLLPPENLIRSYLEDTDLIICADGGANRIVPLNIKPDYIIGDLDSITLETMSVMTDAKIFRKADQETTDLFKALEFTNHCSASKVRVFGATGERPDHSLGNLSLLKKFKDHFDLVFIDEWCTIRLIKKSFSFSGVPGQTVSLWPLSPKAGGVTTKGLKYPLNNETLYQDTRGISNEMSETEAEIKHRTGDLLVFIHHPAAT
jgi:thiamine pyrophosphokinase